MRLSLFLTILMIASAGMTAGCSNTVDGVGRDVERAGEKIQSW